MTRATGITEMTGITGVANMTGVADLTGVTDLTGQAERSNDLSREAKGGGTTEWIVLSGHRAINLAHVSDIKFVSDHGVVYATVRLSYFNPTTNDKEGTSWFNVSGADLELLRACILQRIAPEFAGQLGPGGPLDGRRNVYDARHRDV